MNQTLKDIEIIVVNDGSPDQSEEIARLLAKTDDRIHIFCKTNGGLSSARNYGIEKANGKYLMFVDSDDMIHPQMCELLVYYAEKEHQEVVKCGYNTFSECAEVALEPTLSADSISSSCVKTSNIGCDLLNGMVEWSVWRGIYSRKILDKLNLRFELGKELGEDVPFTLKLYDGISNYYYIDANLYYYYVNPGSIMHSVTPKILDDYNHILSIMISHYGERENLSGALASVLWGYCVSWQRSPRKSWFSLEYEKSEINKIVQYLQHIRILPAFDTALKSMKNVRKEKKTSQAQIMCYKWFASLYSKGRLSEAAFLWHIYDCLIKKFVRA